MTEREAGRQEGLEQASQHAPIWYKDGIGLMTCSCGWSFNRNLENPCSSQWADHMKFLVPKPKPRFKVDKISARCWNVVERPDNYICSFIEESDAIAYCAAKNEGKL